ncbi:urease accessory protein UreF [Accumulibacter sp.]|uniref:urease accessory protein UreF n=1 Tax=Accumulibacter sp. TaxID=2053492 RepID=UPI0025DE5236|nr:urease accessory protein UreF [Accumulibacter sp.]MCM8596939.1 urease accessory protein UreF [Accumulibacter sp.]MCM8624433.1 urease accessory protein UreF [Accumulibacter sp.]MDS4051088.1 urease accessory protein UreF [Accumulibacter sp.]
MTIGSPRLALPRLLQLASPALPVGAYTYSQGLEWAIDAGIVGDAESAGEWIGGVLGESLGRFELPLLARLHEAWRGNDRREVERLNGDFLASRESAELRAEAVQMGYSLRRLLGDLDAFALPGFYRALPEASFPAGWALAACVWQVPPGDSLTGYLWSWAENQVMAALKAVPLGQAAGQRILLALGARIPRIVYAALDLPEERWSNFAPGLALASMRHETQYSRLFRS